MTLLEGAPGGEHGVGKEAVFIPGAGEPAEHLGPEQEQQNARHDGVGQEEGLHPADFDSNNLADEKGYAENEEGYAENEEGEANCLW
ncbi:hypothetical protein [Rothia nasimurium]|uniref:hypothetical protein n=1 Tax=Rothia nasimurium TaxID=85336 RepID=UPI001D16B840|nr:hypothetical protein [Rothia nasimurium]